MFLGVFRVGLKSGLELEYCFWERMFLGNEGSTVGVSRIYVVWVFLEFSCWRRF